MATDRLNALPTGFEFEGYRIESVLSAGGFGVTYRATEVLLDRPVAIKEFLPSGMAMRRAGSAEIAPLGDTEAADFAWGLERFRAEAQTLVNFRHPNIVPVHRYFETHGSGYLVMEFVEGQTLAALLNLDKTLEQSEIEEILDPLLDGLAAIHQAGFLHCDIKPANIVIRVDGSPVLIGFGAARQAFGQHSELLTSLASAGYAPYEQYDSSTSQGPWSDIYALAGVLYRCVTGRVPVEAPARVAGLDGSADDPLPAAAESAGDSYAAALLSAIDNALAVREADRPQSVAELKVMLGADAPVSGEATPRKRGITWKIAGPFAAMVVGGIAVGTWALSSGESTACRSAADLANTAIAKKELSAARRQLAVARTADCSDDTVGTLQRRVAALATQVSAAQAEARRKAAAAALKRLDDERKRRETERRKRVAESERKRIERARRMREEIRRRASEEDKKKRPE